MSPKQVKPEFHFNRFTFDLVLLYKKSGKMLSEQFNLHVKYMLLFGVIQVDRSRSDILGNFMGP